MFGSEKRVWRSKKEENSYEKLSFFSTFMTASPYCHVHLFTKRKTQMQYYDIVHEFWEELPEKYNGKRQSKTEGARSEY